MIEIPIGTILGILITTTVCFPLLISMFKGFSFKDPVTSGFLLGARGICLVSYQDNSRFAHVEFTANQIFHKRCDVSQLSGPYRSQAKLMLSIYSPLAASKAN